jgi:hypothetical protein
MSQEAIFVPSSADASRIRAFLRDARYSLDHVLETLGMAKLPSPRGLNKAVLMDLTSDPIPSNILFRCFYMGMPLEPSEISAVIPDWFVDLACASKLLLAEGKQLLPKAMLIPLAEQWIAADLPARLQAGEADFVLWPNPTTQLLLRMTVRRPSRATLDLGTGTGVQAIKATSHSERVVATDLNARAIEFARFNARLNGADGIDFRVGDGFAPLENEKFDLIVSNPPFFIAPSNKFLFCDNPMDLDQLCRKISKDAAEHLHDGGYFQMLCEWAEIDGQPWRERVSEWFEGTGCDAWVMKCQSRKPNRYASDRIAEAHDSCDRVPELFREYMAYYRERRVEAIHDGMVVMRRRTGNNWVFIEENDRTPDKPFGDLLVSRFEAQDLLNARSTGTEMLNLRPKLSPNAQLEQISRHGEEGWETANLNLRLVRGFPVTVTVQPLVAEFLSHCDGKRTLGELIQSMVESLGVQPEQVQTECVAIIRKMISQGFVDWV